MAKLQTPEQMLAQLDRIDSKLSKFLSKLNETELANVLQPGNWTQLMSDVGLTQWVNKYTANYDTLFRSSLKGLGKVESAVADIGSIRRNMSIVKASNNRTIVGYLTGNSGNIQNKLIDSIVNGTTARSTTEAILSVNTLHTPSQVGTVVNTAYSDFGRSVTAQVFKNEPEQRFRYTGGVIPTSSEECRWLFENQKPEGYTKAEIDAGITTPFGTINWNGREPNFNCIHEWLPKG